MPMSRPDRSNLEYLLCGAAALIAAGLAAPAIAHAEDKPLGKSFVETFDRLDKGRWYVSDGWSNGAHQNCTWSKDQVKISDGILRLSFDRRTFKDRDHVCGEIQTRARFGHGTYEIRMKAAAGAGLNTGFFTYIGEVHKQPHDEIDFEVLGKDPAKVQINRFVDGKNSGPEKLVPVPGGAAEDFHDYAFVWEEGGIRWYVDGKLVGEAGDPERLPSHPGKIYVSLWGSDNLTSWMGAFSDPASTVTAEIDRIAYTAAGEACQFPESVACSTQSQ